MPNILTEKPGPLPLWAWLGIATVGALLFASKGKGRAATRAAAGRGQQQLAAEEAALANSAQTASPRTRVQPTGRRYGLLGERGDRVHGTVLLDHPGGVDHDAGDIIGASSTAPASTGPAPRPGGHEHRPGPSAGIHYHHDGPYGYGTGGYAGLPLDSNVYIPRGIPGSSPALAASTGYATGPED